MNDPLLSPVASPVASPSVSAREAFLAKLAPRVIQETVPPFGLINIRQLPVAEVETLREAAGKDSREFCRRLIVASVLDDFHNRVFTDADLPALAGGVFGVVDSLVGAVLRANGMGQSPEAAEKN
jgi:hypothetical protein